MNELELCRTDISNLKEKFVEITGDEVIFQKEAGFAIQAFEANSFLLKTARNNPSSLRNAITNLASIGITLNPAEKQAYLVPRGGKICLDISYMGLSQLATSYGSLDFVKAMLVHDKDSFEYMGANKEPLHKFSPFKERGEVIGVYCIAKTAKGDYLTEMMSADECFAIRDRTQAWQSFKSGKARSCPWHTDQGEMMKKTVIKRAAKLWPRINIENNKMNKAIDMLNEYEGIEFEKERAPVIVIDYAAKELKIKKIKELSGELVGDKTIEEKGLFLKNVLKVSSFKQLTNMLESDLNEKVKVLEEMVEFNKGVLK